MSTQGSLASTNRHDRTYKRVLARDRGWRRDDLWAVVGGAQAHVMLLVAAAGVVMLDVLRQDRMQLPFAHDEHPAGALGAEGAYGPFRISVARSRPEASHPRKPDPPLAGASLPSLMRAGSEGSGWPAAAKRGSGCRVCQPPGMAVPRRIWGTMRRRGARQPGAPPGREYQVQEPPLSWLRSASVGT